MKKLLGSIGVLLLIGAGYFLFSKDASPVLVEKEELSKPWMEVLSARVSLWDVSKNSEIRELHTGDEIEAGVTIHVDAQGLANIYFPNGSVMRLDKDTTLTLTQAEYDSKTDTSTVRATLSLGRIWSKVVSLVTPESAWEVQTANTVVTVRGTAFGLQAFKNGRSTVIGSEGKVATKKKDQKEEVLVTADTFVTIEKNATTTEKLVLKAYTDEVSHEPWVISNKSGDRVLEAKIEAIRKETKSEAEVRTRFREQLQEEFRPQIELRRIEPKPEVSLEAPGEAPRKSVEQPLPLVKPVLRTVETKIETQTPVKTIEPVQAMPVVVGVQLKPIPKEILIEGETMPVKAVIAFRDAPSKDLGTDAVWKVVGPIGTISSTGVFAAKLGTEVTENGTGKGFIVVTWKDPKTGEEFLAKSPAITVNAAVSATEERPI